MIRVELDLNYLSKVSDLSLVDWFGGETSLKVVNFPNRD